MKRKSLITYAAKKLSNLDKWEKYKDKIWNELKNTVNQFNSITDLKFKIEKDHIPMNKTSLESFFNKEFSWYFEENIKSFLKKYKIIYDNDIQQLLKQLINNEIYQPLIQQILSSQDNISLFNELTGNKFSSVVEAKNKFDELQLGYCYPHIDEELNKVIQTENFKFLLQNYYPQAIRFFGDKLFKKYVNIDQILKDHFNCTREIFKKYITTDLMHIDRANLNQEIHKKIQDFSGLTNYKNDIYKYLVELDNDDKIGQFYGEIDYDPHSLSLRKAPIVVYRDFTSKPIKDIVLIGNSGDNHLSLINRDNIGHKATDNGQLYISECYWYDPCAFIDTTNGAYTIDEIVQILKNDPRIKKVYLSPGSQGGMLKRLAKLM